MEFLFRKRGPNCSGFRFNLVKDFFINWSMESLVECSVKGFPETICSNTWISIVFDSFSSGKFVFVNLIHQLPWAMTLACHFSDLSVEECPFGVLYNSSELLPTFQAPRCSIFVNGSITLIILPLFGVSCDS